MDHKSRKRRKKNTDIAPEQEKELVYFLNDTILEAVKFLAYENWSQMRFLCHRYPCKSDSIVSFDQEIKSANAVGKWFQNRCYSCDETLDIPLEKVFAGLNLSGRNGLYLTIRAFFLDFTEKNMPLTRSQAKQMRIRAGKEIPTLSNDEILRSGTRRCGPPSSGPPRVFSAELNFEYKFYGPILSHFFRFLYHPAAYFREVSMFAPMTDKFCEMTVHSPIRCDQFTLKCADSSLEQSLKWLKDNVRAQEIILSFHLYYKSDAIPISDIHSLVSEFLLQDASICARDRIELDGLEDPGKFVKTLLKKYETLEVTKAIPSILIEEFEKSEMYKYFESNLVHQDDPTVVDKFNVGKICDKSDAKSYELRNKIDGNRKMIAQLKRRHNFGFIDSTVNMRFE